MIITIRKSDNKLLCFNGKIESKDNDIVDIVQDFFPFDDIDNVYYDIEKAEMYAKN